MFQKLRSRRGETLAEMLVSIVVFGLSVAMMVLMIMSAGRITQQTNQKDSENLEALSKVEGFADEAHRKDDGTEIQWNVTISDGGRSVSVHVDGYEAGGLKSYKMP